MRKMQYWRDVQRNVKTRNILLIMGLAVLLIVAATGCNRSSASKDGYSGAEKTAFRELRTIAATAAEVLNVYMDARITDMLVNSTVCEGLKEALSSPDRQEDANRILGEWLKISGAYDALVLLDKKGVCLAAAPGELVGKDFSDEAAFKGAVKGQLTVTDAHRAEFLVSLAPKSRGCTAAIGVPVKVGDHVEGVLISYLKWSRIEDLMACIRVAATGYVYILNSQNQVIMHPAASFFGIGVGDRRINLPGLGEALNKKVAHFSYEYVNPRTGRTDTKFVGLAYAKKYGKFPGLGWTVAASANESEIVVEHPLWRLLFRLFS